MTPLFIAVAAIAGFVLGYLAHKAKAPSKEVFEAQLSKLDAQQIATLVHKLEKSWGIDATARAARPWLQTLKMTKKKPNQTLQPTRTCGPRG